MNNKAKYFALCSVAFVSACSNTPKKHAYSCVPFSADLNTKDKKLSSQPQTIPGRIQNEFYDTLKISDQEKLAGAEEGLCYRDSDNHNSGSGDLNKSGDYQSEFRKFESPDISYVKFNNPEVAVDDSPYNLVKPDANTLYLGWISPGEWVNYTVNVKESGYYSVSTLYTSKFGGHISFEINDKDISGPLELTSTFNTAEPIEWRQAHHWNKAEHLGRFYLQKGRQVLRLHFLDQPVLNFDYMDFEKIQ